MGTYPGGGWTRSEKLALAGLLVAITSCLGTYATVPEFRQVLTSLLISIERAIEPQKVNLPAPVAPAHTPQLSTPTSKPQPPTLAPAVGIGDTGVREKDGMVMVYVPGGTFKMGSTEGEADEQPAHTVTLDGFWIDRTEVTNAQYARCVAAGVCSPPWNSSSSTRKSYYGESQYDDYPVIFVNWNDATTYCEWAGGRLPSEAEWEYAARGPDGHIYPWGNDPPDDTLLNYDRNVGDTTKVGSYPKGQSWAGALDMAGNVYEWVNDWYGDYPSEPQVNPSAPAFGQYRVLRGGSWKDNLEDVRAAYRNYDIPVDGPATFGFRCVVSPGK
jgi:formylglycine-generating enzyme required for sulfatase activity